MPGIDCGTQIIVCEYPVRLDTYKGCSHGCRYCFAQKKQSINEIEAINCSKQLVNFIQGKRSTTINWCDWDIPLHWGGLSDPFQPIERKCKTSLAVLEIFKETKYPFIVSTKGKLITEEPYLSILKKCNAVVQISMLCSSFDELEPGAPTFEERLEMISKLTPNVRRVIVRAQPYMLEIKDEFIKNIPKIKEAGAYGITVEGMKFYKKKPGLIKVEGDYCYPLQTLKRHYEEIKQICHANGLAFYCAENRLRPMGDSSGCCGCSDLKGFKGNEFNCVNLINRLEVKPTEKMKQKGTGAVFHSLHQSTGTSKKDRNTAFATHMMNETKRLLKKGF